MGSSERGDVTELLLSWRNGSDGALEDVVPLVYAELRRLARAHLRRERPDHSLQPTALTHEVFLRVFGARQVSWQNRAHFFAVAAQLMRRILVEHARKRGAAKRGGMATRIALDEVHAPTESQDVDVIALHEALGELEKIDPRQSRIVELKYIAGLSSAEAAEALGGSLATVKRDWSVAKLWLRRALESRDPP